VLFTDLDVPDLAGGLGGAFIQNHVVGQNPEIAHNQAADKKVAKIFSKK